MTRWDRYYGRKLGNERKGFSKYISREVMETIEWMLPFFIRTFISGDPKITIKIKGQDPKIGKALMQKIHEDLSENEPNMFTLFYVWFKDALVSNTALIKQTWNLDQETVEQEFPILQPSQFQTLTTDPDVTVKEATQDWVPPFGLVFRGVRADILKTNEDQVYAENMPHWEFICSPDARGINDEYGKGQKTKVTLDYLKRINRQFTQEGGEPFFKHLDEFERDGAVSSDVEDLGESTTSTERINYLDRDIELDREDDKPGPGQVHDFVEWYDRIDINGDGFLENCTAWFLDKKMIRYELNEEGFIPFSALTPIIDCHKMFGVAWAELIVPLQNLVTMITRRILDNFDFTNRGRWGYDPDGQVDVRALLNAVPGDVVRGKKDAIFDISPQPMDYRVLGLLQHFDKIKEDRGGVPRLSKGIGDDTKTDTSGGIAQLLGAAGQRMDMVARIFAETGVKDFYKKCVWLYQRNLRKPFSVTLRGEEIQVTPEQLQGKVICTVNLGIETAIGQQEAQKIERVVAFLGKMSEQFPGLVTEEDAFSICTKYVTCMGFPETNDFLAEFDKFIEANKKAKDNQGQMMQMKIQLEQAKQSLEVANQKLAMAKLQQDGKLKIAELKQDMAMAQQDREQRDRDSVRDHKAELIKLLFEKLTPQVEGLVNREIGEGIKRGNNIA